MAYISVTMGWILIKFGGSVGLKVQLNEIYKNELSDNILMMSFFFFFLMRQDFATNGNNDYAVTRL